MNYKARCYESHPALPLKDGLVIYGGSCSNPVVTDADVYVGFDYSMKSSPLSFPWVPGESFLFPIADMHAPSDPKVFSDFIDWLIVQLTAKKKVHIGCIGGHGRTGTVLAALVARMMGIEDAIVYVRRNYCPKAVESVAQIEFLQKHFGVLPAEPTKVSHGWGSSSKNIKSAPKGHSKAVSGSQQRDLSLETNTASVHAAPTVSPLNIWSAEAVFAKRGKSANMSV